MGAKKAMKGSSKGMKSGQALSKGALAQVVADETELKKSEVTKVLNSLAGVAAEQVKKVGKCTIPGVCLVKTRVKPATKAGKREMFGKVVVVQAMKARTVVKAFPVAALKQAI